MKDRKGQNPLLFQFLGGLLDKIGKGSDVVAKMIPPPPTLFPKSQPTTPPEMRPQPVQKYPTAVPTATPTMPPAMRPQPVQTYPTAIPKTVSPPVHQATPTAPMQQPTPTVQGFKTAPVPPDYANLINQSAQQHGIPPAVLASLLFTEHGFSRDVGINKNADGSYDRGPAQINSKAHPEITDQQAMDPNFAIPWAANLLKNYIQQTGSVAKGIAAYNVGVGGASAGPGGNLGPRGQNYLSKVKQGIDPKIYSSIGL